MAEQRLIDANESLKRLRKAEKEMGVVSIVGIKAVPIEGVIRFLENAPTVDAVKVVRCKNCEHCDWYTKTYELTGLSETKYWCSANKGPAVEVRAEHFCSYGVVKN